MRQSLDLIARYLPRRPMCVGRCPKAKPLPMAVTAAFIGRILACNPGMVATVWLLVFQPS
jgi:hypothetical protein